MDVFSIYDVKAKKYAPIFCSVNADTAKRQFLQMVCTVPFWEDYQLYCFGHFDDTKLEFPFDLFVSPALIEVTEDEIKSHKKAIIEHSSFYGSEK